MTNRRADVFVASVAEYIISVHPSATNNLKNVLRLAEYVPKKELLVSFKALPLKISRAIKAYKHVITIKEATSGQASFPIYSKAQ